MKSRRVLSACLVAGSALVGPLPSAGAQEPAPRSEDTPEAARRPLLLAGARASRPIGPSVTVGMLIPLKPLQQGSDFGNELRGARGLVVEAAAGSSGYEVAAGWGRRWQSRRGLALFGEDVLGTVFRKTQDGGGITYVGAEAGLTLFMFRMSAGAATRIDGPVDADRTIFTWGLGFHIGR